ncbi:MAG TPA: hypothetical protein VIY48_19630 [Candidatus Paceibacterota bacterium]
MLKLDNIVRVLDSLPSCTELFMNTETALHVVAILSENPVDRYPIHTVKLVNVMDIYLGNNRIVIDPQLAFGVVRANCQFEL